MMHWLSVRGLLALAGVWNQRSALPHGRHGPSRLSQELHLSMVPALYTGSKSITSYFCT